MTTTTKYTMVADGALEIVTTGAPVTLADGTQYTPSTKLRIEASQIANHRRDPDFNAMLPDELKAALDARS